MNCMIGFIAVCMLDWCFSLDDFLLVLILRIYYHILLCGLFHHYVARYVVAYVHLYTTIFCVYNGSKKYF